jgi:hypothetical protein
VTLLELLVALTLTGVVAGSVYRLLLSVQRAYRRQTERVMLQANLRTAAVFLSGELLELDAVDTVDGDLPVAADSAITYKASRSLYVVCRPPLDLGPAGSVAVWQASWLGLRGLDAERDSVVVYAEADSSTAGDDHWVHAGLAAVAAGNDCPDGARSLTLTLAPVHPPGGLAAVRAGAPLRGVELVRVSAYRDAQGDWWLGLRQFNKGSGWSAIQPVLGPLEPSGLRFDYLDADGGAAPEPQGIARVAISVVGAGSRPLLLRDTVSLAVTLRGNPWPP